MRYRIKEHRARLNLTQDQLADLIGCSRQYVNRMETDDNTNVSIGLLLRMAKLFDCKVDDLFFCADSLTRVDK